MVNSSLLLATAAAVILIAATLAAAALSRARPRPGCALVVYAPRGDYVSFETCFINPLRSRAESVALAPTELTLALERRDGVTLGDCVRVDVGLRLVARLRREPAAILEAARAHGARAGDPEMIAEQLLPALRGAVKRAARKLELEEALLDHGALVDLVEGELDASLLGPYTLDAIAVTRLSITEREHLDPNNVLDARGLRKLVTREQHRKLERFEQERREAQAVAEQTREAAVAIARLEQQRARAEARQAMEIEKARLRELQALAEARRRVRDLERAARGGAASPDDELARIRAEAEAELARVREDVEAETSRSRT